MFSCLFSLICIVFMCVFLWFIFSIFPYGLFVINSQVIGCEDRLRNDLYCVGWGVKLCSIQSNPIWNFSVCAVAAVLVISVCIFIKILQEVAFEVFNNFCLEAKMITYNLCVHILLSVKCDIAVFLNPLTACVYT